MSDWLQALQEECTRRSQGQIATELGVSPSVINQALKGVYKGNTKRLQSRVEGRYLQAVVDCPVLGELQRDVCISHQMRRKFAATNPLRVQLHKICPGCHNYQGGNHE